MTPRLARGALSRARGAKRRVARALGFEPHRASEGRQYWEARGAHYRDQVREILDANDPYALAQKEFIERLRAIEWTSILEVGCGFGWHMKAMRAAFPGRRVHGLDFSLAQLKEATAYLASASGLIQAEAARLPAADGEYDIVFTSGLLVCVHPDAVGGTLQEITRVARRAVMTLEYAREHIASREARDIMDQAAWHGHAFTDLYRASGLQLVHAAPFAAFSGQASRVPLSFFHGNKRRE